MDNPGGWNVDWTLLAELMQWEELKRGTVVLWELIKALAGYVFLLVLLVLTIVDKGGSTEGEEEESNKHREL